jgi:hypothetical protein
VSGRRFPRDSACALSPPARTLRELLRGWSPPAIVGGAGLVLSGCGDIFLQTPDEPGQAALDDQQRAGWNVGGEGMPLAFPGAQETDIAGGAGWWGAMPTLASRLAPSAARWAPYYGPALFQSLEAPRSADLRFVMRPIFTPELAIAHRRGEALVSLMIQQGVVRDDVAIILDLPGPESVAVAAALAPWFDPVFVLDNWPHPMGVVPAHLTLGAALYFLPSFERDRAARVAGAPGAPPVFVLDRQRLAPYGDDANQFDNRYLATLPSHEALQAAGIKHVLYVTPNDQVTLESDDINADLVAINDSGVDVRMLALSDFAQAPLPDWPQDPTCGGGAAAPASVTGEPLFYFGGSPGAHNCFSAWYGWEPPLPGGFVVGPVFQPPPRLLGRCHFHPTARATFVGVASGGARGSAWRGGGWRGGGFGRSGSMGRVHFGVTS